MHCELGRLHTRSAAFQHQCAGSLILAWRFFSCFFRLFAIEFGYFSRIFGAEKKSLVHVMCTSNTLFAQNNLHDHGNAILTLFIISSMTISASSSQLSHQVFARTRTTSTLRFSYTSYNLFCVTLSEQILH